MSTYFIFAVNTVSSAIETSKTNDTTITNNHQLQMECISILEKLSETVKHGNEICLRIISCYKLATCLGKTYQSLLMLSNPIKFLRETMESNIENKFETANNIIISYKIKKEDVAMFLTENITVHISRATEGNWKKNYILFKEYYFNIKNNKILSIPKDGQEDSIFIWGYSMHSHFHLIMELCSDTSLLGLKLLKTAQSLLGRYISTHDEKKNGNLFFSVIKSPFLNYNKYINFYVLYMCYSCRIKNNSGIINKIARLFHGFL